MNHYIVTITVETEAPCREAAERIAIHAAVQGVADNIEVEETRTA